MNNLYPRATSQSKSLLFMNQDLRNILTLLTLNAVRLHLHFFKQPLLRTKATALGLLRTDRSPEHDRDDSVSDKVGADANAVENSVTGDRIDAPGDSHSFDKAGGTEADPVSSSSSLPYVAAHPPLSFNPIRAPGPRRYIYTVRSAFSAAGGLSKRVRQSSKYASMGELRRELACLAGLVCFNPSPRTYLSPDRTQSLSGLRVASKAQPTDLRRATDPKIAVGSRVDKVFITLRRI